MIAYIKGKITGIFEDSCFIETAGIGYRVFISQKTRQKLQNGESAKLLTYMAVREDAILLYGFGSEEERDLFLILISISKIGPKVAMGILSAMTPGEFVAAVKTKSLTALTKLPGIGKKTAERLLVELKDKVGTFETAGILEDVPAASPAVDTVAGKATQALMALGYTAEEVAPVIGKLAPAYDSVSKLVSAALREFAKGRE